MPAMISPTSRIPGPESIRISRLQNGIQLLSFENWNAQSIYMVGILGGGSDHDPVGKTGLAHFTSNLLSRGTTNIPFQSFHDQLEAAGASLSFSCSGRHAWFRGKALAEDIALLFRLASDGLRNPAFEETYIERFRRQLLAGLALRDQDTSEVASLLFDRHLFPGHPYGLPADGYPETIKSITRADILAFQRTFYSPQDMTIVISGAVSNDQAFELANTYFSDWGTAPQAEVDTPSIPPAPTAIIRKHHFLEGKSQVDLILGSYGPFRTSPDYLPAVIGNNILGQFGLMGRIGKSVRSDAGLAYFASSSINAWRDAGVWDVSAGVNPENTQKAIDLIRSEIAKFIAENVTDEELDNSKSNLIGRMPMALETNAGIANAILNMHQFDLGFDYYQKYPQSVTAVTAETIRTAAEKYLHPDRLVITSAGPGEEIA